MANIKENQSHSNFSLLTENLHSLFIRYITDGRFRAPPESDLADMIPTFQQGAKTHRRALQSKFKCWAKRMIVDDGKLKLTSGKEIVPREKCGDLVMRLHYAGHKSTDMIIEQIEKRYTWSKKHFGMERDMVLDFIYENCSNMECKRQAKNEISKRDRCDDFIKSVITAAETRWNVPKNQQNSTVKKMNDSLPLSTSPSLYTLPRVLPFPSKVSSNKYFFHRDGNSFNKISSNAPIANRHQKKTPSNVLKSTNQNKPQVPNRCHTKNKICSVSSISKKRAADLGIVASCKKPKTIHEFKNLLKAAEQLPGSFPPILSYSKTKFLGSLNLVPKRICSKKTLLIFEREKRHKKAAEKRRLMYNMTRKNLRDRNKLNKIKLQQQCEKPPYLDVSRSRKNQSSSDSIIELSMCDRSLIAECGSQIVNAKDENVKTFAESDELEIINVTSSGDEANDHQEEKSPAMKLKQEFNGVQKFKNSDSGDNKKLEQCQSFAIPRSNTRDPDKQNQSKKAPESAVSVNSTDPFYKLEMVASQGGKSLVRSKELKPLPPLKPYLIPANIKGEVAVIPHSRVIPIKPLVPIIAPDLKMKKTSDRYLTPIKSLPSIQNPITNAAMPKEQESREFFNLYPVIQLPMNANIKRFVVKEPPKGALMMVPFGPPNNIDPKISRNVEITQIPRRKLSPAICDLKSRDHKNLWKSFRSKKKLSSSKSALQDKKLYRKLINEEMVKLSTCIGKMKVDMVHAFYQNNVEKSAQRLEAQINAAIALVKSLRRKLYDMEKIERMNNTANFETLHQNVFISSVQQG